MPKLYAKRLDVVEPSPTLAITAKAKELKSQGKDVISFGAGEPDFDTPEHIKEAAKKAMDAGQTKYTPVDGTLALKDAIVEKFKRDNGLEYDRKEIIVGAGGKQVIYNYFLATLNPGDEVVIPAPYWVSYADIVRMAEGVPVIVNAKPENSYLIQPEELEANITKNTKVLLLNSPSNPTGFAYERSALEKLGEIVLKKDINVLSDDIYEKIIYDGFEFSNLAMLGAELKERTFIVNGVSKAYSMTGWRIGYGAGDRDIVKNMGTIQSQSTSNPASISQAAATAALNGDQSCVTVMVEAFVKRRDLILQRLNAMKGVHCMKPQGAFYAFPDVSELFQTDAFQKAKKESGEKSDSKLFCSMLLDQFGVAAVPGIAFGDDSSLRLSYAMSESDIEKGMDKLEQMVTLLSK